MRAPKTMLAACAAAALAALPRVSAAAPPWTYKAAPGDRLTYRLDYRARSKVGFANFVRGKDGAGRSAEAAGAPQRIDVAIRAGLVAEVVGESGGQRTVALRLHEPRVTLQSDGAPVEEQQQALAQGLSRPALAQVDARGRIAGLRFDPATTPEVQLAARALYALVQFVLPEGEAIPRTWQTTEVEPNGEYTARYTLAGKGDKGLRAVHKRKLAFAEEPPAQGAHEMAVQKSIRVKGQLAAGFDVARGRLASLQGTDDQSILLDGREVARARVQLSLQLESASRLTGEELQGLQREAAAREQAGPLASLRTSEPRERTEAAIQRGALKGASADEVFGELARLEQAGGEEQPVYLKVKALLTVDPPSAARAGELLAKAKADGPSVRVLSGALGTVGHEAAQSALAAAALARAPDDPALPTIASALGELPSPLPVAEDALRRLALAPGSSDSAATARLSLGTLCATLARTDPPRAARLVQDLLAALQKGPPEEEQRQLLLALGNARSAQALPALKAALSAPQASVRRAAAKALARTPAPEADALLAQAAKDADEHVRKAAQEAQAERAQK